MMQSASASGEPRSASFILSSSSIVFLPRYSLGHLPEQLFVRLGQSGELAAEDQRIDLPPLFEQVGDRDIEVFGELLEQVEGRAGGSLRLQLPDMRLPGPNGIR